MSGTGGAYSSIELLNVSLNEGKSFATHWGESTASKLVHEAYLSTKIQYNEEFRMKQEDRYARQRRKEDKDAAMRKARDEYNSKIRTQVQRSKQAASDSIKTKLFQEGSEQFDSWKSSYMDTITAEMKILEKKRQAAIASIGISESDIAELSGMMIAAQGQADPHNVKYLARKSVWSGKSMSGIGVGGQENLFKHKDDKVIESVSGLELKEEDLDQSRLPAHVIVEADGMDEVEKDRNAQSEDSGAVDFSKLTMFERIALKEKEKNKIKASLISQNTPLPIQTHRRKKGKEGRSLLLGGFVLEDEDAMLRKEFERKKREQEEKERMAQLKLQEEEEKKRLEAEAKKQHETQEQTATKKPSFASVVLQASPLLMNRHAKDILKNRLFGAEKTFTSAIVDRLVRRVKQEGDELWKGKSDGEEGDGADMWMIDEDEEDEDGLFEEDDLDEEEEEEEYEEEESSDLEEMEEMLNRMSARDEANDADAGDTSGEVSRGVRFAVGGSGGSDSLASSRQSSVTSFKLGGGASKGVRFAVGSSSASGKSSPKTRQRSQFRPPVLTKTIFAGQKKVMRRSQYLHALNDEQRHLYGKCEVEMKRREDAKKKMELIAADVAELRCKLDALMKKVEETESVQRKEEEREVEQLTKTKKLMTSATNILVSKIIRKTMSSVLDAVSDLVTWQELENKKKRGGRMLFRPMTSQEATQTLVEWEEKQIRAEKNALLFAAQWKKKTFGTLTMNEGGKGKGKKEEEVTSPLSVNSQNGVVSQADDAIIRHVSSQSPNHVILGGGDPQQAVPTSRIVQSFIPHENADILRDDRAETTTSHHEHSGVEKDELSTSASTLVENRKETEGNGLAEERKGERKGEGDELVDDLQIEDLHSRFDEIRSSGFDSITNTPSPPPHVGVEFTE
ncbi:hypothetical protein ADUPG1_006660 [Aduncisulcus paluster]|uniref:Pinin/SDK/MemA protein domain-containing protein n=1 Tax=Aduncisulcus paluster TaxID=2918883 RepID=A0ABQ5KJ20_9EUKA|nr:hypothetical protein ADUPG1_006660 [Aduncisulcus paluster]